MAKYTYEDIIMDPNDPRLENAIGKECYFADYPKKLLNSAIYDLPEYLDCLTDIRKEEVCTFVDKKGNKWASIIIKKEKPYAERAKKWIKENDLKVNDYVKVTRKAEIYEDGWGSLWNDSMTDYIGKAVKVLAINSLRGLISLECDDAVYDFPYFVLEKAEKPESQYVPFESKEEFIEAFQYHDNANYSETEDILMNYGMWLWSNENGSYKLVTEIWNAGVVIGDDKMRITNEEGHIDAFNDTTSWVKLFSEYRFLDGTPCGKLEKEDQ